MSASPHRDAAQASVEGARARYAAQGSTDPVRTIAERMNVEICAAVLTGAGEMMDLDVTPGRIGIHVNECVASALASVMLTLTQGDQTLARGLIVLNLDDLCERLHRIISEADQRAIIGKANLDGWKGRS